jgi:hypothetical protein
VHPLFRLGQAVQFNFLLEKGGFVRTSDGKFHVDFGKVGDPLVPVASHFSILNSEAASVQRLLLVLRNLGLRIRCERKGVI